MGTSIYLRLCLTCASKSEAYSEFLAYVPESEAPVRKHWFCTSHCSVLEGNIVSCITLAIRRGEELPQLGIGSVHPSLLFIQLLFYTLLCVLVLDSSQWDHIDWWSRGPIVASFDLSLQSSPFPCTSSLPSLPLLQFAFALPITHHPTPLLLKFTLPSLMLEFTLTSLRFALLSC